MTATPTDIAAALGQLAVVYGNIAAHAATIAHTRRTLFLAYVAEGFSEVEALELCKVLALA